jgi:uncharacterized surface protein with fasciclin (FAS1) repeats
MPSKKDKRAKGVQMTEQQPKILQIIDIVHTPPTADIVQMPESTDTRHVFCPFKNSMVNVPKLPCIRGILLSRLTRESK